MAFGGVATGNIKAQLAAKQTGIANETGKTPIAIARPPKTGKERCCCGYITCNFS